MLSFIILSCALSLIIFLAGAALNGSFLLVSLCVVIMVLYFVGVSKLNRDKEKL
jgi:NADH:ubiquinone oxidoreductase subunit 6 (subunit J)